MADWPLLSSMYLQKLAGVGSVTEGVVLRRQTSIARLNGEDDYGMGETSSFTSNFD